MKFDEQIQAWVKSMKPFETYLKLDWSKNEILCPIVMKG